MPNFDHQPPADLGRSGYRLLRTPAAHPLIGHILSDNLVGCRTHFYNQRTSPCESPNCDMCDSGIAWRWHGYVVMILDATQEIIIFECTARSAESIAAYYQRHGTTRGAHMKASRVNSRPNGRVLLQCKPADLQKISLPKAPPVEKLLCHIWNIPANQVGQTNNKPRPPFPDTTIDRTKPEEITTLHQAADYLRQPGRGNGDRDPTIDPTGV